MRQISMADAAEDDGLDLENKQKVTDYLRAQVRLSLPFSDLQSLLRESQTRYSFLLRICVII
jgi:hypothetical protein